VPTLQINSSHKSGTTGEDLIWVAPGGNEVLPGLHPESPEIRMTS